MTRIYLVVIVLLFSLVTQAQVSKLVTGKMIDQKTEEEIEEVELKLINKKTKAEFLAETDDQGIFTFKNIPLGKYDFHVTDKDYMDNTFPIELTADHLNNFTFGTPITASLKVSWMFNWGDRTVKNAKGDTIVKEHYWSHLTGKIILTIYGLCLLLVFFYSVLQLSLAIAYVKNKRKKTSEQKPVYDPSTAPMVTVQLPMFNELYVADRIIETIANFDYPQDKLQIQVLDDSTDETKDVIAKKVAEVAARGINIQHIHRVDRTGYKAGALDAAMDRVQGEFIAIFDADFIPDPDFLQKTMPHFQDEKIGVVQTRWGHINKTYSVLTELQAFGLNGHFAIEQGGRNSAGHFINFNGTGGVWRKKCIEEAGGWEHDTLTEDLDLSYRAQIKGWQFKYLEDVVAPAELPITMSALKSQQHRWMKGGAECFVKMWKTLLTAKGVKVSDRIHGLSHLFNSTVFVFILTISILSLFVLHIKDSFSDLNYILQYMGVFIISTIFLMFYYWHAYRDKTENTLSSFFRFVGRFFQFLVVSMGLSLSNTVAVLEGYLGIKSSFVRTPKFNVSKKSEFKGNKYDKKSLSIINIAEGTLMVVFGFTAVSRGLYGDLGMLPFHLMLAIGYGVIFFSTLKEIRTGQ
ncbi:MAG: cellulose synthase family protein [Flavobacteriales bacterium]|jgi:cellulose synthase/poly-beta-1,6-N-acetylglucosamine synthase-like glycosyltransferase